MAALARIATQLTEGTEVHHELPMSPEAFGVAALGVFAALLAFTWAFRNFAKKH